MKKLLALFVSAMVALSLAGCTVAPPEPTDPPAQYTYQDFTPSQKDLLKAYLGEVIPFAPNDHYFLEGYNTTNGYDEGFRFHTTGNTAEDFLAYQANFTDYIPSDTYLDEDGHTWYSYVKGNLIVDISYYTNNNVGFIDVYARLEETLPDPPTEPTEPTDPTAPTTPEPPTIPDTTYTYNDWSESDKALFTQYIGALIPFLPNNEYVIEGYYEEADYENGLRFITTGNTEAEFNAYLTKYAAYTFDGTYVDDEYGDTWHCYSQDDVVVDMTCYAHEGVRYVEVYVYSSLSKNPDDGSNPGENTKPDLITNDGKGLPTGNNGVFDVNFKDATNVKDVTDQGHYLDGCPTVGAPAVLVIPIGFTDGHPLTAENIDNLERAFGENGEYYYSVDNFYKIASYGQLDLDITVLDQWYIPAHDSSYYAGLTDSDGNANGDQILLDEVLENLSHTLDLSKFDSDGNTVIDAVILINNLDVGEDDFHWAYRYWNMYSDNDGYYYEYDGVSANDYIWASYFFLHESYAGNDVVYDDMSAFTTYTYIHEFGHVLGADDYYDTSDAGNHPMDGCDIMDSMLGDHNAYTKFNLGWLTTSRLVVTDSSVTLTLEDFSKNGDTIIIANNWDPALGAYQEYYIVVYYTNNGLNGNDNGYFARDGVVVYHINASLYSQVYGDETYYDVYNNNTDISDTEYGTADNLIEFVKSAEDNFTYVAGDTLPVTRDDSSNILCYTFTVDSLTADTATITFTKR